jgi:iron(III) transport system ATP-binding protein
MNGALTLDAITLRYGDRAALDAVSLSVGAGDRLAIVGRSGAGKTSLLRVIAGLQTPDAGSVRLGDTLATEGQTLHVPPEDRRVSMVFQQLALWPHMTVEKTLCWVARGKTADARREASHQLAERVGLGDRLSAFPSELSGGEQQRLAYARALASDPTVLLLDEPFAHLDAPLRAQLITDLLALVDERKTTLVLVTHQSDTVQRLATQVVVLASGKIVDSGDAASLLETPASLFAVDSDRPLDQ